MTTNAGTTLAGALGTLMTVALVVAIVAGAGRSLGLVEAVEGNLALLIDLEDLNADLVTNVEHVLDLIDATLGNAGDVEQTVFAGQQLDEGAEGLDAHDATGVLLPHLGDLDDGLDALGSSLARTVGASDEDGTVLLDVDGGASVLLDATDDLAAGADDVADLVRGDLEADNLGSGVLGVLARCGDLLEHLVQDEHAALVRLHECLAQDLGREAGGLVVHLHGGDALGGARHLEVHIAEEVLETLDVGEDDGLALLLDEAHGNAGDRALDGHAGIHERQRGTAGGSHRAGAVGLHDLGDHADGVGELLLRRNHGKQRALGQRTVANLAALGAAHATGLTGAVGREVVVVDVALAVDRLDGVKALPLVEHAQGADGEHLGLATLEEARAVDQGQVVGLDHDRANLGGGTAVDALAGLNDHLAHGVLLEALELDGDGAAPLSLLVLGELGLDGLLEGLDLAHAGELVGVLEGGAHLVKVREDAVVNLGGGLVEDVLLLDDGAVGLLPLGEELLLLLAEGGNGLLAKRHGGQHVLLADLLGASLEHGDERGRASQLEVEVGGVALLVGGVHEELARLGVAANAHAGKRALEGHATDGEGGRGTHHADGVNGVDLVCHERSGDDLHLVAEAVGEGRAQRAVDHAGREGGLLRGPGLTLEVSAGDAAHGVHLLDEVDRQGEEVVILALLRNHGGHEDGRVPALHQAGARGLLCELARLESVVLSVEVELVCNLCHTFPLISACPIAGGPSCGPPHHARGRE